MSLLSALLTQDQVVSARAIDEAIQREALGGGDFETCLLESGTIGEDTLARYSAAVHGMAAAARSEVIAADPSAVARLPRVVAERYQMVALRVEAGRLVVVTATALTPAARIEAEAAVMLPVEALCVTRVRLAWALWRYYQVAIAPRDERLATRLQTQPPGEMPAEVTIPLTRPKPGARASALSAPAFSALAAFDAALDDDDAAGPSEPPTPLVPRSLRERISSEGIVLPSYPPSSDELPHNVNRRTNTPPLPMIVATPRATAVPVAADTVPSPPVDARATEPPTPVDARPALVPPAAVDAPIARRPVAPSQGTVPRPSAPMVAPPRGSSPTPPPRASVATPAPPRASSPTPPPRAPSPAPPAVAQTRSAPPPAEAPRRPSHAMPPPPLSEDLPPLPPPPRAPTPTPDPLRLSDLETPRISPPPVHPVREEPAVPDLHAHPPARVETPPPSTRPMPMGQRSLPPPAIEIDTGAEVLVGFAPSSIPPPLPRGIPLEEALRRIDAASDRDAVVDAMLAHVHQRFAYAALFMVQTPHAIGLSATGEGILGAALRNVSVSLETRTILRAAHDAGSVEVSRIAPDTPDAELRRRLARESADEVVVAPLRIGQRVALLLWADDGRRAPTALAVRDLDAFTKQCAVAFERIIAARKRGGRGSLPRVELPAARPRERAPLPDRSSRMEALKRAFDTSPGIAPADAPREVGSDTPTAEMEAAAVERAARATPLRAPSETCAAIVNEVVETGVLAPGALETLLERGEVGIDAVFRRFPGPNRARQPEVVGKSLPVEELGPLLRAVVAFRLAALPRLLAALDDADAEVRYCALLCLTEVVHPTVVAAVVPKLTDADYATRLAAVEVLRAHRRFDEAAAAGRAMRSTLRDTRSSAEQRRAAASALGELRDAEAVPALAGVLDDLDAELVTAAHRALTIITRQNFGVDGAPWLDWWARAQHRHRVEWLIDALLHTDATLRHEASEELKALSGQYFGYYFNLPRRERERAHARYVAWWQSDASKGLRERTRS